MGADEAHEDNFVNRKKKSEPKTSMAVAASPLAAANKARQLADKAKTLKELREAVEHFDGCLIKKTANKTVFSDGNPQAKVMLIGEAPGANEDMEGIPFCGASGQLLDKMLAWIGLTRKENLYITNTIFWRPPGNRRPTPEELEICRPFVEKHIALIDPKIIILAGGTAATLIDPKASIGKLRGRFYDYTNPYLNAPTKMAATFHPSYLMRSPSQKKLAWADMLKIQQFLRENGLK